MTRCVYVCVCRWEIKDGKDSIYSHLGSFSPLHIHCKVPTGAGSQGKRSRHPPPSWIFSLPYILDCHKSFRSGASRRGGSVRVSVCVRGGAALLLPTVSTSCVPLLSTHHGWQRLLARPLSFVTIGERLKLYFCLSFRPGRRGRARWANRRVTLSAGTTHLRAPPPEGQTRPSRARVMRSDCIKRDNSAAECHSNTCRERHASGRWEVLQIFTPPHPSSPLLTPFLQQP